jgi:hypothetical protein
MNRSRRDGAYDNLYIKIGHRGARMQKTDRLSTTAGPAFATRQSGVGDHVTSGIVEFPHAQRKQVEALD